MENVKETQQEPEVEVNAAEEEIIKPDKPQKQEEPQQQQEGQQLQQHQELQQQEIQKHPEVVEEKADKLIETPGAKPTQQQEQEPMSQQQQQETHQIDYEEDDDEDDDDDDEEKETSQKLVIDIPEDEEEEEDEKDEEDDDEVIALDDLPQEEPVTKENDKISPKPEEVEAIITLSDGEEDVPVTEAATKPAKIQKRKSMGAGSVATNNEEERYRLKRRKINVAGAPKMPLTGYVRYMNDRRESLRKEHPTKTAMEHTKMIGEEWHALPADVKSTYLKAADADKQRYVKELHSFLKSRPDILASELAKNKIRKTAESNSPNPSTSSTTTTTTSAAAAAAAAGTTATKSLVKEKSLTNDSSSKTLKDNIKDKMSKEIIPTPSTSQQAAEKTVNEKTKRKRTPTPPTSSAAAAAAAAAANTINTTNAHTTASSSNNINSNSGISIVTPTPGEIPIFTNEFLEHNKIYDMELRSLRKSKTDLEQQNSVLEKHVENMKFGVEKMITENNELEEKNRLLEIYLDKLKRKLALALSTLPLPSAPNGATVDNIDKYMLDLYKMSTSNSHGPATLNKAKDIIRKLDLQIQL